MLTLHSVKDMLATVMQDEPELTIFGIGVHHSFKKNNYDYLLEMQKSRVQLLECVEQVHWTVEYLNSHVTKINNVNKEFTSYTVKHVLEKRHPAKYLSNGVLIAAAMVAGYPVKKIKNSPNVHIGFSSKDIKRLNKENINYPRNR